MTKLKVSAAAKARRAAYVGALTAEKNKKAKVARHCKAHPNDAQSAARKKPATAGRSHEKRTPLEARLHRSMNTGAFGSGTK